MGGLGSALADILLSYTHYAPITFIVKGIEGYIAGTLLEKKYRQKKSPILAMVISGIWMGFGYYLAEIFMYGGKAALASVPANLIQGLTGAVTSVLLFMSLKRTKIVE